MRYRSLIVIGLCIGMAYLAVSCAPSGQDPADAQPEATSAYQTLVALGVIQPEETETPSTRTPRPDVSQDDLPPSPTPTLTPTITPTQVQGDCTDEATFGDDIDVTIPDDTEVAAGISLRKTWRITNSGTCTWTPSYQLVFSNGDQMGGPTVQPLSISVSPGASANLSIDIVSPTEPGTYQGFWRIRNAAGAYVDGPTGDVITLWVKIVVSDDPLAADIQEVTLVIAESLSGYVLSDGSVGVPTNVGDTDDDLSMQAFMTWVVSSIPVGSNIQEVEVDFSDFDTLGTPFADLQCLRAYPHDYGTLDSSDYIPGPVTGSIARWCDSAGLGTPLTSNAFLTAIQDKLGSDHFQIRMQFNNAPTDGDGVTDLVRFGEVTLLVRYIEP
jgi:hypothetical protein